MSKLAEQFIKYATDNNCTQEEFEEAIDYLYATTVDMMMDKKPNAARRHSQAFDGYDLVITARREFLN